MHDMMYGAPGKLCKSRVLRITASDLASMWRQSFLPKRASVTLVLDLVVVNLRHPY